MATGGGTPVFDENLIEGYSGSTSVSVTTQTPQGFDENLIGGDEEEQAPPSPSPSPSPLMRQGDFNSVDPTAGFIQPKVQPKPQPPKPYSGKVSNTVGKNPYDIPSDVIAPASLNLVNDALKVSMPGAKYDDTVFDNDPVINVGVDSHTRMSYWAAKGLQQSINEAKKAGITIDPFGPLTSTRTYEQQAGLKASKGKLASNPGKDKHTGSLHQFGFAIDVSSDNYADLDKIMEKRGFARSVHGEEWHYSFQPALPSNDPERVWKDNDPRMAQWKNTLGYAARGSIDDIIVNSSTMHGFGPKATSVINRMFTQESGKRTHDENGDLIMSPVGAAGIGQMMPGTLAPYLKARGITQAEWEKSPNLQIDISVEHLKGLINKYDGNMAKALAAYNGGEGAVMSAEKNGGYRPSDDPNSWYVQTVDYVSKIMDISRDEAMKYISAPKGTPVPEVMADYREPGDMAHVSRDVGKGVSAWTTAMMGEYGESGVDGLEQFEFRIEKQLLEDKGIEVPEHTVSDMAYAGVSFVRGITSMVTDVIGSELQSFRDEIQQPGDPRATLGDFDPTGIYSGAKNTVKMTGIGDDSAAWIGDKLRAVSAVIQPETTAQEERDTFYQGSGGIDQRRGAASFWQYVMGLPWSPKEGGTDLSMEAVQANMESLGLEFPYLFGTMVGGLIMRKGLDTGVGGPVRNIAADMPAREAAKLAEHWAKNPTATNAFKRIIGAGGNPMAAGAAEAEAAFMSASGQVAPALSKEAIADVLAYGWIGGGQSGALAYSDALTRGATMQEAVADGIVSAAVGVGMGLALPLMFSRPVMGAPGSVVKGAAGALNAKLPASYPWKEYVAKSVTDLVKAMDEAMVPGVVDGMEGKYGPFTRRVAKSFRFFKEQTEKSQRMDHVNAVADDLQSVAGTYDNAASTIDQQLATHQEHVTALQDARQAANEMVQYLERNPNLKIFGKGNETQPGWIPRLEKTEAIVQQAQSLPSKTIEEQQAWIQENQDLMQAAGAKDVSELLAPSASKKGAGEVTQPGPSKLDNWARDEKKKIIGEAGTKGISAGQIGDYRRNLAKVRDIDDAIAKVQKSPIAQGMAKFQEASKVLRGTANQLRSQAEWLIKNRENPFENIGPQDKVLLNNTPIHPAAGLDPLQLQAQMDTFQQQIAQLAKDGTWMGAGKDAYAFESTRQTRTLLQASGIFGEDIIENAVQSVNDGKLWVSADIGSVKNSIKSAKATVERIDQAGTLENQGTRFSRERKVLRNRLIRTTDRLGKLDIEKDFLEKSLGELERNRLLPEATPENIAEYRNTLTAAQKKLRYAERVKANIKSRKNLIKESERNIDNAEFEQAVREHPRLNYGKLADYDAVIDANKIGIKRANRSIDYGKGKLSDIEAEIKDARNITAKLTEDLDALTRKRDYLKRKEYLDKEIPLAQKDVNKATGDLEGHAKIFDKKEALKQKRREIKKGVLEKQIATNEKSLERMEGVEAVYAGAEQGLKDTSEQLVAAVPSTRPGDKGDPAGFFSGMSSLPDVGEVAAKFDAVSQQEQSFNPLGGVVKMWDDLTRDQRIALYSRELMAATDNFLDKVNPQREALKAAGGHPDIWKLFDEKTFSPDQGIASLVSKEVWQAAYGLRASEINASNVASNAYSGIRKGTQGALNSLKAFVDLDTPTSVTQMLARGRNTFKTMVHQTNHARQISSRVRDVWNHTMEGMDSAYTEGRVGKKVLKPEIAKEMVGAIEGMMDGPTAMREFLQKYPGMKEPMQLYLGVTRAAEQYKIVSPELRSAFRDGYFQHKYPFAREILNRGRRVDWDRISTQLSSEGTRKIDSLSRANELYTSAVDELKNSGYTGTAEKNLEKEFIGGTQEKRARMLGITDDPLSKKAFDKVNWTLDRLALKDPVTDPGHVMESILRSTFETAALRNALKNGANIPVKMIDPETNRPFSAIFPAVNKETPDMPLAAGGVGPAQILSKVFNLADHDVVTFGGKDYKAGDLRIHPDLADEIKYNFQNNANTSPKMRAAVDLSRSLQLMGNPMAHSWNILSGHWTNLSLNALNSIGNSAYKAAKGLVHLSPTEVAEGMQGFWKGGTDLLMAPVDAVSLGAVGNKALSGEIPGIDPQMLVTDAITHGLNLNMFETTMRSAQDMANKWIESEDPELFAEMRKGFLERATTRGNTPKQIWDEVLGEEGLWGNMRHLQTANTDSPIASVAKAAGAIGEAGIKGLINGDHFLNNYFTYEPMRQAAIAAYNLTTAIHWERMGTALQKQGVPFSQALKIVKEEAARRINGLNGTLQSYQKISGGRGAFDWENTLYGTSGNQGANLASTLVNGTTPGWLRSKIDLISNGVTGSRLKDIENEMYRNYMQKEWRKQLFVGAAVGVTAQQMLQYLVSGGTSGVFAAAFDPSNEGGRMDALKETMSNPKLFTEIQLGSNTAISTPFYGQLRDMVNLTDGIVRRPEAIANMVEGNISKLGLGMVEIISNRDLLTGKNIRIDDTSLDPDAKYNWARDSAAHLGNKVTESIRGDILMRDTRKGGMKPMSAIVGTILGLNVRDNNPEQRMSAEMYSRVKAEQNQTRDNADGYARQFAETGNWEFYEKGMKALVDPEESVTGAAKNWTMIFPNGKATLDPKEFANMVMKYTNPALYVLNTADPKFRMEYMRRLQKWQHVQQNLYFDKLFDEHYTSGEQTLKQEAADE